MSMSMTWQQPKRERFERLCKDRHFSDRFIEETIAFLISAALYCIVLYCIVLSIVPCAGQQPSRASHLLNSLSLHLLSLLDHPPTRQSQSLFRVSLQIVMTDSKDSSYIKSVDSSFGKLPDHLLIEIFIRVPVSDWACISCVKKQWADIFRGEFLWRVALTRNFPLAVQAKRWPGPIPRGLTKRRFAALYVSKHIFCLGDKVDEIVPDEIIGHTYLFLKEQLELPTTPPSFGVLHGTIIDQFIACGKSRDEAHELSSRIWLAVLDNMEENERTFLLLKRLAMESDIFLPYPYPRSVEVQWRVFEKLLTDFRDCFDPGDCYDILTVAKNKFYPVPSAWLGY